MNETVSVSIAGPIFSCLYYENSKCESDQEGFLLGEIITRDTNKVTDADHRVLNREKTIAVKTIAPCPHLFYFFNSKGEIDTAKIRGFLGAQELKVVGWYIFKRKQCVPPKLAFREKIIHKRLAAHFNVGLAYFTCCLLTAENSKTGATYMLHQTFMRYCNSRYDNLPLHIVTLNDPNFTYKSAEPLSGDAGRLVNSIIYNGNSAGHLTLREVQNRLQKNMQALVEKSIEKEQQLFLLEQRVKQLKENYKLSREYGTHQAEVSKGTAENGVAENSCIENSFEESLDNSPETPKRKRGRPRNDSEKINSELKICDAQNKGIKTRSQANVSFPKN